MTDSSNIFPLGLPAVVVIFWSSFELYAYFSSESECEYQFREIFVLLERNLLAKLRFNCLQNIIQWCLHQLKYDRVKKMFTFDRLSFYFYVFHIVYFNMLISFGMFLTVFFCFMLTGEFSLVDACWVLFFDHSVSFFLIFFSLMRCGESVKILDSLL